MKNSPRAKQHCAAQPRATGRPGGLLLQLLLFLFQLSVLFVLFLYFFNSL